MRKSDRTLVKAYALANGIDFRTVSRTRKSPRRFYILRSVLEALPADEAVIVSDIHCFAMLHLRGLDGTLRIEFTWLQGGPDKLDGWEETVVLPYETLMDFVRGSSQEDGPKEWRRLSLHMDNHPKIVFYDQEGLRKCLENKTVRGKLARALRDNFHYPNVEQISLYHDFAPYSFLFQEVRAGRSGMVGGLILHNHDNNLKKAYYSVHT